MKIICISDEYGREINTDKFDSIDLSEYHHIPGEDCECAEDDCDCGFFGEYLISIYELPENKYEGLLNCSCHSSHYLSEHGKELCLGDFV